MCVMFQDLFSRASDMLEHETGSPLSLITFQLPRAMLTPSCRTNITVTRLTGPTSRSDVVITGRDPVFGSAPFSVQHQGCGMSGLRVVLPSNSLVQAHNVSAEMGKKIVYTTKLY